MIACYYLGLRWIILIMQSYLLIFFTGFLVTFIYNNKKGRKKKKISFHISWLTLKDNKFPLKHPIFGITENNIIPLLDSLTQPAGVQTLKRGNVPKDIWAILIKPPKLSLSLSLTHTHILLGLLWLLKKIFYFSPGNINYSWQY